MMRFPLLFLAFFAVSACVGCSTTIAEYPLTKQDSEKYASPDVEELDYDTNAYVIETRGGGAIACVNLGASDGVKKGSVIEFFKMVKRNKDRFDVLIATGTVFQVSKSTCWVQVDDYEDAGVRVNHFARLAAEQPKNPVETVKGWFKKD
jgi:hypothetical protein